MKYDVTVELMLEVAASQVSITKTTDARLPQAVAQQIKIWLSDQDLVFDERVLIWEGVYGIETKRNFYIISCYIPDHVACTVSAVIWRDLLVADSCRILD